MEKITLKEKIQRGLAAVWDAVKAHPVEIVILLYVCVAGCYGSSHPDIFDVKNEPAPWWFRPMSLVPFMVVAAYSLQPLRKRGIGWLLLYLLPLAGMVAGFAMPFLLDWVEETVYWIAVLAALPLWLCVRHRLTENEPFVQRNVQMAWSAVRALLVAGILYLLYAAIAYTIKSLFEIPHKVWDGWYEQAALLLFCGLVPVLFFAMEDRPETIEIRRFWAVLLNWVLTPALLIYTVVLYVYAAKILFTWNLPKGGVAIMVTVFFVVFLLAKMLQMLTEPQPFKWFYDHFSLFVLPLLALFWTGVARRLMDYGLTEWRYYLLLGGILMTCCVLVFLFRNRRGYFALAAGALCVVLLVVLVPPLRGEKVAMRSQVHRVRTLAQQLDRLNDDGTLRLSAPDPSDTVRMVEHRRLYQSLDYIGDNDTLVLKREFGLLSPRAYLETLSELTRNYASAYSEEDAIEEVVVEEIVASTLYYNDDRPIDIKGYSWMYADGVRWYGNSIKEKDRDENLLQVGQHIKISINQIWAEQLRKFSFKDQKVTEQWLKSHANELLVYRTDSLLLVFNWVELSENEDGSWYVNEASVNFVMEK
jgi:hypothetical protein